MIKILHLVNAPQFVDIHIDRFKRSSFSNHFVYLSHDFPYKGTNADLLEWILPLSPSYHLLIANSGAYDMVIVYNLDYLKSCFVNAISKLIKVVWHFYGTEIYNNYEPFCYSIYSEATRKLISSNKMSLFGSRCKRFISRVKYWVLNKRPTYTEIHLALLRVNYFSLYAKAEYDYLQAGLKFKLPPFLQLSVFVKAPSEIFATEILGNGIWLGNSAAPENNHLDILRLFQKLGYTGEMVMPFSYSGNEKYSKAIKSFVLESGTLVKFLDNFLNYDDYIGQMIGCRTAVYNSYRQMAMGNILISLKYGLKVYMNNNNPYLAWFALNGFKIYSVQENLAADIRENDLSITDELKEQNKGAYSKLLAEPGNLIFLEEIRKICMQQL
jgi:hypothetical protein